MPTYYNPTRAPVSVALASGSTIVAPKGTLTVPEADGITESLQHAVATQMLVVRPSLEVAAPPEEPSAVLPLRFPAPADHVVRDPVPPVVSADPASAGPDPLAGLHDYFPSTSTSTDHSEDPS